MSASADLRSEPAERPTRVRYGVLVFLCLLTFILYLDRICMAQAAPAIQHDMGLSDTRMGFVHGAFTLAYGLFMAAAGRLGDRFGSRGVLVGIVLWWSAFTALTGAAIGFVMLVAIRFVFGAGEAGALPNCARVVSRWFPAHARGLPQGLLNTAALVGGAVAPVAVAYVIEVIDTKIAPAVHERVGVWPIGWRWAFVIFGAAGVLWALAFWRWYRDDPATHPGVNGAERAYINRGRGTNAQADEPTVGPVPWDRVMRSRNIWLLGLIITCASFTSYMYMSWYPRYVQDARHVEPTTSGWLASIVMAGGAIGSALGGVIGDRFLRRKRNKRTRCWIGAASMASAALVLVLSIYLDDPRWAAGITAIAFFCMMLQIASWWGAVADISGPHLATLFGLANSLGVVGAIGSQLFFGAFADWRKDMGYLGRDRWDPAFYIYGAVLLIGAAAWLRVNPNRSAVE
jgi:MFS transporter, ACS family, glucarate transporter